MEDINFAFNEERIIGCVGDKIYCRDLLAESELEGEFSCTSSNTDIVNVLNSGIKFVYLYLNEEGKAEIEATLTLENGEKRKTNLTVEVVKRQIKFTTNENPIRIPLGKTIEVPVDKRYPGYYYPYSAYLYYDVGDAQVISVFQDIDSEKIRGLKIGTTALTITHKDLTETREVEVYTDIRLGDVKVERDFPGVTELSWTMENTLYYRIERAGGCFDKIDLMAMAPANGNRTFKKGTNIEDFGEMVVLNCKEHGNVYMPLLSKMCTGYDENTVGEQIITVHYKDKTTTFTVTIKDSGNSGTNNSNTGNSGSSGGGGGGGSRGNSGGRSLPGGPGAASGISSAPVLVGFWIKDAVGWWFQPLDKAYPKNQ